MARPVRPELVAFLDDVKQNPDDLTPWLVLTDWLEEHGDEADRARAEYCRLCFDKLGKKTYASDWEKGERRRELFREWGDVWLGTIKTGSVVGWQIRRGLLTINAHSAHLLSLREEGVDAEQWEWVEELTLYAPTVADALRLIECPLLMGPSIIHLTLGWEERITYPVVKKLAMAPCLERVRTLHVTAQVTRSKHPNHAENVFRPLRERLGDALKVTILQ